MFFKYLRNSVLFLSIMALTACFEEDEPLDPDSIITDSLMYSINMSIYDYQTYFNLQESQIASENPNDAWDLAFETGPNGWHIRINSGNRIGIYNTATTDFENTSGINENGEWAFDKSDGNMDSTAVGNWLIFNGSDTTPKQQVYIIGQYDGIAYKPFRKIVFTNWSEKYYWFTSAAIDGSDLRSDTICKNNNYNYVYYSFDFPDSTLHLEPDKDQWDILFTQYYTILYTDDGQPLPYLVRGVFQNPNGIEVALDSTLNFYLIDIYDVGKFNFSKEQDAIGYEWKDVKVNQDANTASYTVDPARNYIIKGREGKFYKLKFISYLNDSGQRGYPRFLLYPLN